MTPDELEAVRERAEQATPGPWLRYGDIHYEVYTTAYEDDAPAITHGSDNPADADFISNARTDIPKLLDHVDELSERLEIAMAPHAECEAWGEQTARKIGELQDRLAAVRELHPRGEFEDSPGDYYCKRCQETAGIWPCPTIQALDGN